jgi:YfiH family protein
VWSSFNLGARCGDAAVAVTENRRRLREHCGLLSEPHWLRQVHGTRVAALPAAEIEPEADASYTTAGGPACAVLTADCLPVLFCDEAASVVAAAHAGWRGLAAGVLEATVAALPVPASRLMAWLGPAIGPEAFEVGPDVYAAFTAHDAHSAAAFRPSERPGHHYANLFELAKQRLDAAGVTRIYGGGISTHADRERFFSFRRDGVTGRQAALIWIDRGRLR